jgi:transposase
MPRTRPPYPEAFRRQIAQLAIDGRSKLELSREFGCAVQSIANWMAEELQRQGKQPGDKKEALSSVEREELERLRRDNARLQQERDILAKATAWFANKAAGTPGSSTQ